MPRPLGGERLREELAALKALGVSDLVSMLPLLEETELELMAEAEYCVAVGLRFHNHPIPDRSLPLQPDFDRFIDSLVPILSANGFIVIHCRAGIGRSSVVAAALLCRLGLTPAEALRLISRARGFEVPDTEEQRAFILNLPRPDSPPPITCGKR